MYGCMNGWVDRCIVNHIFKHSRWMDGWVVCDSYSFFLFFVLFRLVSSCFVLFCFFLFCLFAFYGLV